MTDTAAQSCNQQNRRRSQQAPGHSGYAGIGVCGRGLHPRNVQANSKGTGSDGAAQTGIGVGGGRMGLTSNATHRPLRRDEIRLADMMPRLFLPNHFLQISLQGVVAGATAQRGAQIVLREAKEAGAQVPIGSQAKPVAMAAERFAHGSDETDFAGASSESPAPGSFRRAILGHRPQLEATLDPR